MKKTINKAPNDDTSKIIKFGLIVIFIVFIILGVWITFAPLAIYSVATGTISADYNKKRVQHLEGGTIKKIFVNDGDFVKKNQILIKLDDVKIKSKLKTLKVQYENLLAMQERLISQKDKLKIIHFNKEIKDQKIKQEQLKLFYTTLEALEKNKQIISKQILQLKSQLETLDFTLKSKNYIKNSLKEEIQELKILYEKKLINKIELRKFKRELKQLESEIINIIKEQFKVKEQIKELKTKNILVDKNFEKETLENLTQTSTKISDIKSQIEVFENSLENNIILAPTEGYIIGISKYSQDSIIKPSSDILEIVPKKSNLIIVGKVKSTDIDKMKIGLKTNIIFSAYNTQMSYTIEGDIIYVSADSFIDKFNNSYYEVKVNLDSKALEQVKSYNFNLVAGMPVEMMIRTGNRTILSYLLKPLLDRFARSFNEE